METIRVEGIEIKVGDGVIVNNLNSLTPIISYILWVPNEVRWKIGLDWGECGKSHVWSTDFNKCWKVL